MFMTTLTLPAWQWAAAAFAAAAVVALGLLTFSKKLRAGVRKLGGWLFLPAALALIVLFVLLARWYPRPWREQRAIPELFVPGYWIWLPLFLLGAGISIWIFLRMLRAAQTPASARGERFPDLEVAWEEIEVRLDHEGINLADQRVYLLIGPDEEVTEALIRSSDPTLLARAPEAPSPIHAYALDDGVLLSCAGASAFGTFETGRKDGAARLEALCNLLKAVRPECPIVRGVALVLPMDWASHRQAVEQAAALRDDLRALRHALKLRCPVYVLFPRMELTPGFTDYIERLREQVSPRMIEQRVGFGVPRTEPFSGELAQRGLNWLADLFHNWILNLMVGGLGDSKSNRRLILLDFEFRRYRKRIRSILESALATRKGGEPILFRGCYFVASGDRQTDRAFSAGLLRGSRSRVLADHVETHWSESALRDDRRYVRAAWRIAGIGATLCLPAWAIIISRAPWAGVAGLLALILTWVVILLYLGRQT
ncbi:hypothetical protein BH23PLA1_BH23PLA1_24840 [soil metagenome]